MTPEIKQQTEQIRNGEVPEGYKHSRVGIIPEDWKVMRLKDKFDRLSRKNAEGNTNVLTISAQYGLINQEEFFKKEVASDDKSNYFLLHRGEYAYNKSYSNGYPFGAIKRLSRYDKGVVSPLYICFSANADNACPEYYEQYFEAGKMNHEIQAFAQEGARNHGLLNISVSDFFNSFILVPPVSEQQRIAKILSAQDKVIECYEKKIAQLQLMKKYYLQNMFPQRGERVPKFRFKGYSGTWNYKKFMDLFFERREKTKAENEDVLLSCAISGMFLNSELFDHFRGTSTIGYLKVKKNDLILSTQNLHLGNANVNLRFEHGIVSPAYKTYDLVNCDPEFIQAWIKKEDTKNFFLAVSTEGASQCRKNIEWDMLDQQMLLVPTLLEQKRIGAFFGCCETIIRLHQSKYEEEKKKKKALQQLLLTGIVRVSG